MKILGNLDKNYKLLYFFTIGQQLFLHYSVALITNNNKRFVNQEIMGK